MGSTAYYIYITGELTHWKKDLKKISQSTALKAKGMVNQKRSLRQGSEGKGLTYT